LLYSIYKFFFSKTKPHIWVKKLKYHRLPRWQSRAPNFEHYSKGQRSSLHRRSPSKNSSYISIRNPDEILGAVFERKFIGAHAIIFLLTLYYLPIPHCRTGLYIEYGTAACKYSTIMSVFSVTGRPYNIIKLHIDRKRAYDTYMVILWRCCGYLRDIRIFPAGSSAAAVQIILIYYRVWSRRPSYHFVGGRVRDLTKFQNTVRIIK